MNSLITLKSIGYFNLNIRFLDKSYSSGVALFFKAFESR